MRLQTRFTIIVTVLVAAPLIFAGWFFYSHLRVLTRSGLVTEIESHLDAQSLRIRSHLRSLESAVGFLAENWLIEEYVLTADPAQRSGLLYGSLLELLADFHRTDSSLVTTHIVLPDGTVDAYWGRPGDADSGLHLSQQLQVSDTGLHSRPLFDSDTADRTLLIFKPLVLRDRRSEDVDIAPRLRGYLAVTADLGPLLDSLETPIGNTRRFALTDGAGKSLTNPDLPRLDPSLISAVRTAAAFDSRGQPTRPPTFEDDTHFVAGRKIRDDLLLFSIAPSAAIAGPADQWRTLVFVILATATLIAAWSIIAALRSLVLRPIARLQQAATDIGSGNLGGHIESHARDEIGDLTRAFGQMQERLKSSNERIAYLAYHDGLTGLPNRTAFRQRLAEALETDRELAILFVDLDNFKLVNDAAGHHLGDQLLAAVAKRLRPLTEFGFLSRFGGDEFVLLIRGTASRQRARRAANQLIALLGDHFDLDQDEVFISASIGISVYPEHGQSAEELLRSADVAMYDAKHRGRNDVRFYDQLRDRRQTGRLALESRLRRAIDQEKLELWYQPQLACDSGRLVGVEALLRWNDSQDGWIPPDRFVPVAEESGLILPLGEWVLQSAVHQLRAWQAIENAGIRMSINVSVKQFRRQDLIGLMHRHVGVLGLTPGLIELEITETAVMTHLDAAVRKMRGLKELGLRLALDDFGIGYSSLHHLRRFPLDALKIDQSFIADVDCTEDSSELCAAIINLGHTLRLDVIAEGVEREAQWQFLVREGCDIAQGYWCGKPVRSTQIERMLRAPAEPARRRV